MWKNRLYKSLSRIFAALIIMSAQFAPAFLFVNTVRAAESASLSQWANLDNSWVNGNLGQSKALLREGDSVPYRMVMDGLTIGATNTLTVEWDTTKGGKHALDYLTSYNATFNPDPCSGVGSCSGPVNTFPIPQDSNVPFTQDSGVFSAFGATITSVSAYTHSGSYASDSSTRITITFTSNTVNPVISWGGHIASQIDWGFGNSAGEVTGSPYHTRLIGLNNSGGNQDRSLSAASISPTPIIHTQASASEVNVGQSVTDHVIVSPVPQNGPTPTGTVDFYVCGPSETNPDCTAGGTKVGSSVTLTDGEADSSDFTPLQDGHYCFRAEYSPTNNYSPQNHTNFTTECFEAVIQPGKIIVKKITNPTGDQTEFTFSTNYSDNFVLADGETNNSADLVPGTYSVSETVPAGWDQTSATCDDRSSPSSIQLEANETVTCTFTNTKRGTLTVEKTTYPSGDATQFGITATASGSGTITGGGSGTITDSTDKTYEVTPGTYSVAETPTQGWELVSNTCDDVVVDPGEDETCQIVNKKYASFTIVKDALPNSALDFFFSVSDNVGNGFTLDDDGGVEGEDTSYSNTKTFSLPADTQYSVSETSDIEGWMLTDIECEGAGATANLELRNASFNLAPGATATCTFTNTKLAKILGNKFEVDADASNPEGLVDWTINLINPENEEILDTTKTDQSGSYSFENLLPGSYTIEEVLNSGWTQITNESGCEESYLVTLVAGEVSEDNDFCNFKNGTIRGYKWNDKNGDGNVTGDDKLSGWTIFIDENNNEELDNGEVSTQTDENGVYEFSNLAPGTYVVCEEVKNNWVQTYPGSPSDPQCHEIVIDESSTDLTAIKSRSFGNQEYMKLTLVKKVINDNGGNLDADDFGITISGFNDPVFGVAKNVDNDTSTYSTSSLFAVPTSAIIVSEQDTLGYSEGEWLCTGSEGVVYDNDNLSVTVSAEGGEDVVCTITNDDISPTLTLKKIVVNDNGGEATQANFQPWITDTAVDWDKSYDIDAGQEVLISEQVLEGGSGYKASTWDCDGGTLVDNKITLQLTDDVTCTITNDDIAPTLEIGKQVINNNSGVLFAESFKLYVNGEEIEFKKGGGEVENSVAYGPYLQAKAGIAYTISEDEVEGYSQIGLECQDLDTELTIEHPVVLTLDQNVRCTITNDDVANPAIQVVKSGPEVAEAGTTVTYSFEVTNIGDVRLSDIEITDTITETPEYISGDDNEDNYLDLDEVWLFEATYGIPENQVAPVFNIVTVCGSQFEMQDEDFLNYRTTDFQEDVEAILGQSDVRVCDQDVHTTVVPQVLGESITVEEPEVLAETGNSIISAIIAGLSIVFLVAILQKAVASDK